MIKSAIISQLSSTEIHPVVVSWARQVVSNGGTLPSYRTVNAANIFYISLDLAGLLNILKVVNIFAPDNLTATLTPLFTYTGFSNLWTNHNFVSSDLNLKGLTGNQSNKYIDSGVTLASFATSSSASGTMYVSNTTVNSTQQIDSGGLDSGTHGYRLGSEQSTGSPSMVITIGGVSSNPVPSSFIGYFCNSKTGTTAGNWNLYQANSTINHGSISSPTPDSNTPNATKTIYIFASDEAGTIAGYSAKTISYYSFGLGLTASQSLAQFNAVQQLRKNLGGGWT